MKKKKAKAKPKRSRVRQTLLDKDNQATAAVAAAYWAIGDVIWGPAYSGQKYVIRELYWGTLNSPTGQGRSPSLCAVLEGLHDGHRICEHLAYCYKVDKDAEYNKVLKLMAVWAQVRATPPEYIKVPKNITQAMLKSWDRRSPFVPKRGDK